MSNSYKEKGNKTGNKGNNKGTKQKDVSPNDNTKTGEKQNQNSDKPKPKQNPKGQNKNKQKLYCSYHKENTSHASKDCLVLKNRNKKIHKLDEYDSEDDTSGNTGNNNGNNENFVTFNSITAYAPSVKSFASVNDAHPMVTSDPLLTRLNVEGFAHVTFEIDSAASHNIISENNFNQLQKELKLRGKNPTKKLDKTIKIRLADGKLANQNCKIVQIHVSTDLENSAKLFPLTFLVVKGPNNLIGRHSLARLWPKEFEQFKAVATNNYKLGLPKNNKKSKSKTVNKTQVNKVNSAIVNNVEI